MASKPTLESKGSPLSTGFSEDGFTDWGSSSGQGDVENAQAKSPHQKDEDRIEYFSLDGRQSDGRPLLLRSKFQTFLRSQPPQHKARDGRIGLRMSGYRRWIGRRLGRRPSFSRMIIYLTAGYLMTLGFIEFLSNVFEVIATVAPGTVNWISDHWGEVGEPTEGFGHWPTEYSGDIRPVNCHSHNDYWRRVPLHSAIHSGCTGVEADVWLINDDLYVGHSSPSLTSNRTLRNLYLNPLLEVLQKQNPITEYHPAADNTPRGVFDTDWNQTLVLLIDFKTSGPALWPHLYAQLNPLRERGYLTHFNGSAVVQRPVTVVGTGNAPFDLLTANSTCRDIFFDAPLDAMADLSVPWPNPNRAQDPTRSYVYPIDALDSSSANSNSRSSIIAKRDDEGQGKSGLISSNPDIYNPTNSYYASVSFKKSIGHIWGSRLSQPQLQLIRGQIEGAHQRGLKVRYWGLPAWPMGLRNHVWHILIREGVDVLNVDDLVGATRRDWRRRKGWWY